MFPTRAQEQMWAGRRKNQWTLSQQILSRLRSRKKNEWRKNEQILRELLETMKCINLCIIGAPEKGRVIILSFHFCFVFCPSSFLYFSSTLIAPILTRPFKNSCIHCSISPDFDHVFGFLFNWDSTIFFSDLSALIGFFQQWHARLRLENQNLTLDLISWQLCFVLFFQYSLAVVIPYLFCSLLLNE